MSEGHDIRYEINIDSPGNVTHAITILKSDYITRKVINAMQDFFEETGVEIRHDKYELKKRISREVLIALKSLEG